MESRYSKIEFLFLICLSPEFEVYVTQLFNREKNSDFESIIAQPFRKKITFAYSWQMELVQIISLHLLYIVKE